ncbi:MAG TPA: acetyl-CoA hydrolase/transferase C-terminal domain-containing protein [Gammaproteobacteria bacterium]|jgi:acyl-CoA hydrolase|nr:acetyl-CoA hydrolase/transferase C-terminal domain-containing protein [Gammaproteobacteria bacterium]
MKTFSSPDDCVEAIIARVGPRLVVGSPLGIGKPNHLLNAIYRRAARDPGIHLRIMTALSLERPGWHSDLERRFMEPFAARVFGDYPDLEYMRALRSRQLPANIELSEFYFKSGSMLGVAPAQQEYLSSNYTHVARDMLAAGVNVVLQAVGKEERPTGARYSLSSNPDVTLDIMPGLRAAEKAGRRVAVAGMVNRKLPFMYGDADVGPEFFDFLVDAPALDHHLFSVPNMAVDPASHMVGLYASTLIRDGGTVQVGIGSLGDAFVYSTQVRHADNARYRDAVDKLGIQVRHAAVIEAIGGVDGFRKGLYAGSEMLGDGLLHLYEAGILKRRVYDHAGLQRLLNQGKFSENLGADGLTTLREAGIVNPVLTAGDVALLKRFGILRPDAGFQEGLLVLPDGTRLVPDLEDRQTLHRIAGSALGARLTGGVLVHAAFFLGSQYFYDALHKMPEPERRLFAMEAVSTVNELFSDLELEELQHRHSRFLNICMKMTLLGAAVSDSLDDGRVVSGVGGQYNFVAMAHALKEARSILMLKSTHTSHGRLESNILWQYAHTTIPRHLRDVVVTEYGIADLRGKSDREVIAALLNVADSRFQEDLLLEAKRTRKIPADYRIPDIYRQNTLAKLRADLAPFKAAGLFPDFPFGHDFTPEELKLGKALQYLQAQTRSLPGMLSLTAGLLQAPAAAAGACLARMDLAKPQNLKERLYARLVSAALKSTGG